MDYNIFDHVLRDLIENVISETSEDADTDKLLNELRKWGADFIEHCEVTKANQLYDIADPEARIRWCEKALMNALASMFIVGKLGILPSMIDTIENSDDTFNAKERAELALKGVDVLGSGCAHVALHIAEYLNFLFVARLRLAKVKSATRDIEELNKIYAKSESSSI